MCTCRTVMRAGRSGRGGVGGVGCRFRGRIRWWGGRGCTAGRVGAGRGRRSTGGSRPGRGRRCWRRSARCSADRRSRSCRPRRDLHVRNLGGRSRGTPRRPLRRVRPGRWWAGRICRCGDGSRPPTLTVPQVPAAPSQGGGQSGVPSGRAALTVVPGFWEGRNGRLLEVCLSAVAPLPGSGQGAEGCPTGGNPATPPNHSRTRSCPRSPAPLGAVAGVWGGAPLSVTRAPPVPHSPSCAALCGRLRPVAARGALRGPWRPDRRSGVRLGSGS